MSENNPGYLGFIFKLLGIQPGGDSGTLFPYAVRDDFLSPAERSFYLVLKQALDERYVIFLKASLKDLFFVTEKDSRQRTFYSNKIHLKHVDFVICAATTLKPVLAIELDDTSHNRKDRLERDYFVNKVFEAAGLQLLRVENKKAYTLGEIGEKLAGIMEPGQGGSIPHGDPAPPAQEDIPICQKCGVPMTLRTSKRGENQGKSFYGCVNFPKCREVKGE